MITVARFARNVKETFWVILKRCVFYESDNFHQKWQIILQTYINWKWTNISFNWWQVTQHHHKNLVRSTKMRALMCRFFPVLWSYRKVVFSSCFPCLNNSWKLTCLVKENEHWGSQKILGTTIVLPFLGESFLINL